MKIWIQLLLILCASMHAMEVEKSLPRLFEPSSENDTKMEQSFEHYQEGKKYFDMGLYDKADAEWQKCVEHKGFYALTAAYEAGKVNLLRKNEQKAAGYQAIALNKIAEAYSAITQFKWMSLYKSQSTRAIFIEHNLHMIAENLLSVCDTALFTDTLPSIEAMLRTYEKDTHEIGSAAALCLALLSFEKYRQQQKR